MSSAQLEIPAWSLAAYGFSSILEALFYDWPWMPKLRGTVKLIVARHVQHGQDVVVKKVGRIVVRIVRAAVLGIWTDLASVLNQLYKLSVAPSCAAASCPPSIEASSPHNPVVGVAQEVPSVNVGECRKLPVERGSKCRVLLNNEATHEHRKRIAFKTLTYRPLIGPFL